MVKATSKRLGDVKSEEGGRLEEENSLQTQTVTNSSLEHSEQLLTEALSPQPASASSSSRSQARLRQQWAGYLFILPTLAVVLTFTVLPLLLALHSSLTVDKRTDPYRENGRFVGLQNYTELFSDPVFGRVLGNTLVFVLTTVPLSLGLAFGLALLLNHPQAGLSLLRLCFFYPTVLPMVSAGAIWLFIYNRNFGLANDLLNLINLDKQNWLGTPQWALTAVIVLTIWKQASYYLIFFLAGLQNLPSEVFEAGKLDGAKGWQVTWYLTLPLLRNTILFVSVIALAAAFQTYDQVAVLTRDGGPNNSTNLLLFNARIDFSNGDYDRANAQAVLLVIALLFLSASAYWLLEGRKR